MIFQYNDRQTYRATARGPSGPKNSLFTRYSVSPAQVVLRWLIDGDWSVIPKSSNPQHIRENFDLSFKISRKDLMKISNLSSA